MKKIFYYVLGIAFVVGMTACEKDQAFVQYDDLEHGAIPRKVEGVNGLYDFFDLDNSSIDFTVEFYDDAEGSTAEDYAWTVAYIGVDGTELDAVSIASFSKSDYSARAETGLPSLTVTFPFTQVRDALGLTNDDIEGGDVFRFRASLTTSKGQTFDLNNTGANLIGSSPFSAWFGFDQAVVCPSELGGDIDYVTTAGVTGGGGPACPGTITGTINLEEGSEGRYEISDASLGVFGECWGDSPAAGLTLVDACNIISVEGADQYGDAYTWTIVEIDGPNLTINFENTYGDAGTSVLTRTDGADWPPLTN